MKREQIKDIAIAMSGGIDSSVTASILKEQGYNIFGFTMVNFNEVSESGCTISDFNQYKPVLDAKKICDKLNIQHYTIDLRKEFTDTVMNYFINEYKIGKTPNPCTYCNPLIKWGLFVDEITKILNTKHKIYDFLIATGHYAKIKQLDSELYAIFKADDDTRDQTYMLWGLSQKQIKKTIFPLAEYYKNNSDKTHKQKDLTVREIATTLNKDFENKKDSQDICFIKGKYADFLNKYIDFKPGKLLFESTENNITTYKTIGEHKGLAFYTLGQRKGLVPWHSPLYVKQLNYKDNTVIVTDNPMNLYNDTFFVSNINWQQDIIPNFNQNIKVQIRYNSDLKDIMKLDLIDDNLKVILKTPAKSITPGQSAVFYLGNQLLGGGTIN
ncbi:MAG: tRNA 2-thiouridine(34) synthase MnmA [Candidatus Cloacimonetes bacterium]|jgi:tRNA-specific 2-thiouridylase|nr:tRNA 2-thiouridine(34) synthase MnmA [Candidatus Cloacimonadota bacterium]